MGKVIPLRPAGSGREAELLAQGWTKRTTIDEPRLSEIAETYRQLGFDVEVIVHRTDSSGGGCNTCFDEGEKIGKLSGDLFVRKSSGRKPPADDLF